MSSPPVRSKTTIRPYIGASLLDAAREAYPLLKGLTDREFIEFTLTQAIVNRPQPVGGANTPHNGAQYPCKDRKPESARECRESAEDAQSAGAL